MVLSEGTKETLVAISVTAFVLLVLSISFLFAKKRARKFKKRTTMATLSSASFSLFLLAVFLLIAITYSNADDIEVEFRSNTPSFKQKKSRRKRYFQEGASDYSDTYSSSSNSIQKYDEHSTGTSTAGTGDAGTRTGTGTSLDSLASMDFRRGVENGIYMQEMRLQRIEDKIKSMFNKEQSSLPNVPEDIHDVLKQELSALSSSINLTDTNPEHYMRTW
jgi:hypothetical protein